jgi:hypothetical protein
MKTKFALSILLFLFLAVAALTAQNFFNKKESASPMQEHVTEPASQAVSENQSIFDLSMFGERKILAVYFHGNIRCRTCLKIEEMARDVVTSEFDDTDGAAGILWTAVNYDVPENDRYVAELKIETPSLILMEVEDGKVLRSKNLRNTWDLVNDGQAFSKYVFDEVIGFAYQ